MSDQAWMCLGCFLVGAAIGMWFQKWAWHGGSHGTGA